MKSSRNSTSLQNNRRYWGSSIFWKQLPTLHTKPWKTSQAYRSNQRFLWHGPDILGALVMAASSVLGYPGQARLEDVPFWSVAYALVTIYCGHCMPSSLLFRATETDALIVCINGVVLAMNLMLLPLTLQVASSSGT